MKIQKVEKLQSPIATNSNAQDSISLKDEKLKNLTAPLLKAVEDCREVLPLVPLLQEIANGRSGWYNDGTPSGLIRCTPQGVGSDIYLDCHGGKFVHYNGTPVPERHLLVLVANNFDLKGQLRKIFENCLQGYFTGYDPQTQRFFKGLNISSSLQAVAGSFENIFRDPSNNKKVTSLEEVPEFFTRPHHERLRRLIISEVKKRDNQMGPRELAVHIIELKPTLVTCQNEFNHPRAEKAAFLEVLGLIWQMSMGPHLCFGKGFNLKLVKSGVVPS